MATIWLAHIISQGDHRKLTVRDWDLSVARVKSAEQKGLRVIGPFLGEGEEELRKMQRLFPRLIATTPDRLPEKLGGMLLSLA